MKKQVAMVLALTLLCISALAEAPTTAVDIASAAGYEPSEITADGEMFTEETLQQLIDFGETIFLSDNDYFQMMLWTDDGKAYGIADLNFAEPLDVSRMRNVFVEILNSKVWDMCAYIHQTGEETDVSINYAPGFEDRDESAEYYDDYSEFLEAVNAAIAE